MTTSFFDLYKIGVGPSSSHTMGPMRAAFQFARGLAGNIESVHRVQADLYGSLALTGLGHGTDRAVLLGLAGNEPASIDPERISPTVDSIRGTKTLLLNDQRLIVFDEPRDLIFHRDVMFPPDAKLQHPNGLRLKAFDSHGTVLSERTFFSIGGGFITEDNVADQAKEAGRAERNLPYPFHSAAELLETAAGHNLTIAELMMANESAAGSQQGFPSPQEQVRAGVLRIWQAMRTCIERGIATEGTLPGGLNVRRRAHRAQRARGAQSLTRPGHPHHVPHGPRYAVALQGNEPRRTRPEHYRVLGIVLRIELPLSLQTRRRSGYTVTPAGTFGMMKMA